MLGIPLGLLAANATEWAVHKHILHGRGRHKESLWAFHWHEHHRASRRGAMVCAGTPVLAWQRAGGRHQLSTPGGTVRARRLLVAANGYNLSFTGNNLTVNQRPVTITADALNKSVGAADPAFSYQVTAGSLANGDVLNLTRAAGQTIGVYPISLGSNPNYSVTYTGNNLSIVAAPAAASSGSTTTTLSGDAMRSVLFSNRPDVLPAGGQDAAPPATVRGNKDGQKPAC